MSAVRRHFPRVRITEVGTPYKFGWLLLIGYLGASIGVILFPILCVPFTLARRSRFWPRGKRPQEQGS